MHPIKWCFPPQFNLLFFLFLSRRVTLKKYFFVVIPLACVLYMSLHDVHSSELPPMQLEVLLEKLTLKLEHNGDTQFKLAKECIMQLLAKKRSKPHTSSSSSNAASAHNIASTPFSQTSKQAEEVGTVIGGGLGEGERITPLDQWISAQMAHADAYAQSLPSVHLHEISTEDYNKLLYDAVVRNFTISTPFL